MAVDMSSKQPTKDFFSSPALSLSLVYYSLFSTYMYLLALT